MQFIKGGIMVEVTESATQQMSAYFTEKDIVPVRIFLNDGG